MNVTQSAKEAAVIVIFRKKGIVRENGRLPMDAIIDEWIHSGLRRGDLDDGIRGLLDSGALVRDQFEQDEGLYLTASGATAMSTLRLRAKDIAEQINKRIILRQARRRQSRSSDTGYGRREGDWVM